MDTVIAELEAATEGSRELSDRVAVAIGWKQTVHGDEARGYFVPRYLTWTSPDGAQQPPGEWWPPSVTQSLDAALSLVPEGWGWDVMHDSVAAVRPPDSEGDDELAIWGLTPNGTPALALCIAALRARQAGGAVQDAFAEELREAIKDMEEDG